MINAKVFKLYLLQTFFHNPIAGPFVLGISSGLFFLAASAALSFSSCALIAAIIMLFCTNSKRILLIIVGNDGLRKGGYGVWEWVAFLDRMEFFGKYKALT